MTDFPSYAYGTVTIAASGTVVTGTGTVWSGVNARPGDDIVIDGHTVIINDVTDEFTLSIDEWPYAAVTDGAYKIVQRSPLRFVGGQARADLTLLLSTLKAKGLLWYLDPAYATPDDAAPPLTADDGQAILKISTGNLWVMQGGAWAPAGTFKGFNFTGAYDSGATYNINDVFTDSGNAYIVTAAPPVGTAPPDTDYYAVLASKGGVGPTGPASLKPIEAWVTATAYVIGPPASFVSQAGSAYECLVAHTSGTFNTDLAAGKWGLVAAKGTDGAGTGDMVASTYDPGSVASNAFNGYPVATRTVLKALDTTKFNTAYLTEAGREGSFIWTTGDFSARVTADTNEGLYVKATAIAATSGAWVRVREPGFVHVDWFGTHKDGSTDDLAILQSAMAFAAGGRMQFGVGSYKISNTLTYNSASNAPLYMQAVPGGTSILMASTGFAIQYLGGTGAGAESRGGGVAGFTIAKTGGGTCSGIQIANVYDGDFHHNNTDGCGNIGIQITSRGSGDTDATYGTYIRQNYCRNGIIGIQVKADTSGAISTAQIEITDNNLMNNASCGAWLASFDGIIFDRNIATICGHGDGGAMLQRGGLYVEVYGITCRNLIARSNEFGNGATNANYNVFLDGLVGGLFEHNRHIRNSGESGSGCYMFGWSSPASSKVTNTSFVHDYVVDGGSTSYTVYALGGASGFTVSSLSQIHPAWVSKGAGFVKASSGMNFDIIMANSDSTDTPLAIRAINGAYIDRVDGNGACLAFRGAGTQAGYISTTTTTTSYNTTSDYRRKINYEPIKSAVERIMSVQAYNGEFKADPGTKYDYFLAHEIAKAVPGAVQGEKDGPEMQAVDYSKVVPLMWAAIQELAAKIKN